MRRPWTSHPSPRRAASCCRIGRRRRRGRRAWAFEQTASISRIRGSSGLAGLDDLKSCALVPGTNGTRGLSYLTSLPERRMAAPNNPAVRDAIRTASLFGRFDVTLSAERQLGDKERDREADSREGCDSDDHAGSDI
jgi:hypothetical protein